MMSKSFSLLCEYVNDLEFFAFYSQPYCLLLVIGSTFIVFCYLWRLHVGTLLLKTSPFLNFRTGSGELIFRLAIDSNKLTDYIKQKQLGSKAEINLTHVVVKACAMAIAELPSLNGHVVMNQFYRSKTTGVDMSVFVDVNERTTGAVKIEDADAKPTEYIANEIIEKVAELRSEAVQNKSKPSSSSNAPKSLKDKLKELIPSFIQTYITQGLHDLGNQYGIGIAKLGIVPYPYGVCTVVTSPDAEQDIDVSFLTSPMDSSAPIVVTLGGYRVMPILDTDGRMQGNPVVNVGVAIHNQAATGQEAKQFLELLRKFLSDPLMMEEAHKFKSPSAK